KACRRPRCIEQCNVADGELRNLVILGQHRPARDLKYGIVVVGAGAARIAVASLRSVSTATEFHCRDPALDLERARGKPAYGERPHPTGERTGVDDFRLVPTTRAQKRSPLLKMQSWSSLGRRCGTGITQHGHKRSLLLPSINGQAGADSASWWRVDERPI